MVDFRHMISSNLQTKNEAWEWGPGTWKIGMLWAKANLFSSPPKMSHFGKHVHIDTTPIVWAVEGNITYSGQWHLDSICMLGNQQFWQYSTCTVNFPIWPHSWRISAILVGHSYINYSCFFLLEKSLCLLNPCGHDLAGWGNGNPPHAWARWADHASSTAGRPFWGCRLCPNFQSVDE